MANFDKSFERMFTNEGGFQNDPNDRGNWTSGVVGEGELKGTKMGISAMSYPNLDIANLTKGQVKTIYRTDWWDKHDIGSFPDVITYQLFDAAINHGFRRSVKMLQNAAGCKADGYVGPLTRIAVNDMDENDLLLNFLAERLVFMTHVPTWNLYGKGWAMRIAHNLKYGALDNDS
ncbi:lysozyme [Alteromonas phage vB_AcoS-R7M]|uniref:Lysozyme n=1 Tax=Alteromonas phage vB_AcoS-R7M TaxID=2729541 RepID=A0A6M3YND9_9CAUD|nr:endolysin [Alteromonas phage vB_AcoS-R7M]QJI53340.1 lysozyme [Alteromonas phage vB_AcoS-R7M]